MRPAQQITGCDVAVTFSVSAPDLDPAAVTAATGLEPDDAAYRWDERRNRAGRY